MGVTDPLVLEQYYNAFDSNKDGKINFKEFVVGLSVVQRGTIDERLQCKNKEKKNLCVDILVMFKAYDTNHDGGLSPTEVYDLIKATNYSKGVIVPHEQVKGDFVGN